jgi:hypothetical protein
VQEAVRQCRLDRSAGRFREREGDCVYALMDVEPHDPVKAAALDEALIEAARRGVRVLLSNPCFEYWLLCHVVDQGRAARSFADPEAADRELARQFGHCKSDLHRNPDLIERLLPRASDAVKVARHVHERHHRGVADIRRASGCTEVYRLVGFLTGDSDERP